MKVNNIIFIFLLIGVIFIACNKETSAILPTSQFDELPLETQEAKNTFGCFINDTLWLTYSSNLVAAILYNSVLSTSTCIAERSTYIEFTFKINKIGYYEIGGNGINKIRISRDFWVFFKVCKISEPNGLNINITKLIKPSSATKGIVSRILLLSFLK
jgi:hypothetical protein